MRNKVLLRNTHTKKHHTCIFCKRKKAHLKTTLQVAFLITNRSGKVLQKYCDYINSGSFYILKVLNSTYIFLKAQANNGEVTNVVWTKCCVI